MRALAGLMGFANIHGLVTGTPRPSLIELQDEFGHCTAFMGVAEVKDCRGSLYIRAARLVGVQRAIAPEDIQVARLKL